MLHVTPRVTRRGQLVALISRFFVIALAVEKVNVLFVGSQKLRDRARYYNVTTVANNQLVLNLVGEGSAWIKVGLRVNA